MCGITAIRLPSFSCFVAVGNIEVESHAIDSLPQFQDSNLCWNRYMNRNLNKDLLIDFGAPTGKYIVNLSFTINEEGDITDIKTESLPSLDYGAAKEIIRSIHLSPIWTPAKQKKKYVASRLKQTITFTVTQDKR